MTGYVIALEEDVDPKIHIRYLAGWTTFFDLSGEPYVARRWVPRLNQAAVRATPREAWRLAGDKPVGERWRPIRVRAELWGDGRLRVTRRSRSAGSIGV